MSAFQAELRFKGPSHAPFPRPRGPAAAAAFATAINDRKRDDSPVTDAATAGVYFGVRTSPPATAEGGRGGDFLLLVLRSLRYARSGFDISDLI